MTLLDKFKKNKPTEQDNASSNPAEKAKELRSIASKEEKQSKASLKSAKKHKRAAKFYTFLAGSAGLFKAASKGTAYIGERPRLAGTIVGGAIVASAINAGANFYQESNGNPLGLAADKMENLIELFLGNADNTVPKTSPPSDDLPAASNDFETESLGDIRPKTRPTSDATTQRDNDRAVLMAITQG